MRERYDLGVPYRCAHCGNRTRFDVVEQLRRRSFHHFTLGGELTVEDEEILERRIESVTCRWCDRSDGVERHDSRQGDEAPVHQES